MSLITYLPSTYSLEKNRFKEASGNIRVDYRKSDGSAPILLETPYTLVEGGIEELSLNILPAKVPEDPHITGDQENYRKFPIDLAVFGSEHQRNILILSSPSTILSSEYVKSTFEKGIDPEEGQVLHTIHHEFIVKDTIPVLPLLNDGVDSIFVDPLLLEESAESNTVMGFSNYLTIKKADLGSIDSYSTYTEHTVYDEVTGDPSVVGSIIFSEYTSTDHGETGADVTSIANPIIKSIPFFEVQKEFANFFTHTLLYVTDFKKKGEAFETPLAPVLDNINTNYYLYSKSINYPQDIIGLSVNVNENKGALLSLVLLTDLEEYSTFTTPIGLTNFMYKTVYTGLFASPFLAIQALFQEGVSDNLSILINGEETILGEYTETTFKHLCAKISTLLYNHGILVVPCKNNFMILSKFTDDADIEIELVSNFTKFITDDKFTEIEYLTSDKKVLFDSVSHPSNSSFTYVESSEESIRYKFKILKDTNRADIYLSERVRLLIDFNTIRGTSQTVILRHGEDVVETSFTVPSEMIVKDIVDLLHTKLVEILPASYTAVKNYLSVSVDILNEDINTGSSLRIIAGDWLAISGVFGGVYHENSDLSKTIILDKNDGSTVYTTGSGPLAVNLNYTDAISFGTSSLDPFSYQLSQDTLVETLPIHTYSSNIVTLNKRLRSNGYEAYPLYSTDTDEVPSGYVGLSRILPNANEKLYLGSGDNKEVFMSSNGYKSAIGMYTEKGGIKSVITINNASIEEWLLKDIPLQTSSRPFEIDDSLESFYGKKSFTGVLNQRDGLILYRREYTSDTLLQVVLNPLTSPIDTCKQLHMFLSGTDDVATVEPTVSDSLYTLVYGDVSLVYDSSNGNFTVTYDQDSLDFGLDIGFTQDNDLDFNYNGWFNYPYGFNNASPTSMLFEEEALKAKILIVSYNTTVDGA